MSVHTGTAGGELQTTRDTLAATNSELDATKVVLAAGWVCASGKLEALVRGASGVPSLFHVGPLPLE